MKQDETLVQTGLRLPRDVWKETRITAIKKGITTPEVVAAALREYLAKQGKQ